MRKLSLQYKLPQDIEEELNKNNNYSLFLQKQPGNKIENLVVDLNMLNDIKSYNPAGFYSNLITDKNIVWEGNLKTDREFQILVE